MRCHLPDEDVPDLVLIQRQPGRGYPSVRKLARAERE